MKKYFLRLGAFVLDMIFVIVISTLICMIPFINPKVKEINTNKDALNQETELAKDLQEKTKNYIKDNKINKFEHQEILDDFPTYYDLFKDVVIDEELTDDFKDNILIKINEQYVKTATDMSYEINKMSLNETIICLVVYLIYFGVVPFITKGQTLAKKILRLKVVDNKDETKDIPLWKYLIRAFLICELAFVIINTILIYTVSKNAFISANYWVRYIQQIYEIAFLICFVLREDQRSIHDLLLNTTVIRIDASGNKIPDPIYSQEKVNEETKVIEKPKEINKKKTTTKKKNTVKKTSAKKEEIKAEKVND